MSSSRLRWRLTVLYGVISVVSGAVLIVLMYTLTLSLHGDAPAQEPAGRPGAVPVAVPVGDGMDSANLLLVPLSALAILAVLSLGLGWLIAGRMLRPVRTMTERVRGISERNVHERLSVVGPRDELKDLADTVDGLLGRLDVAIEGHKRFVANAAHELRTPLTAEHALLEEPLMDPDAPLESYRANFERLLVVNEQRTRLLEALLTLSGSEHGRERSVAVDLPEVVTAALRARKLALDRHRLRVDADLAPIRVTGDPALVERLVANLLDNAIHYNVSGGRIEVSVRRMTGRVLLGVANSGALLTGTQVDRLFEPFQRLHRTADDGHHGLGLSIVRAIAVAHEATLTATPFPNGGLTVTVGFPVVARSQAPAVAAASRRKISAVGEPGSGQ